MTHRPRNVVRCQRLARRGVSVHLGHDGATWSNPPIRVGAAPDGSLTYLVDLPPEALPPVARRDLERAWYAARRAALAEQWGAVRVFRFKRADGGHSDLVLADRDASCWAAALDTLYGMGTRQGPVAVPSVCWPWSICWPTHPGPSHCCDWRATARNPIPPCCTPPRPNL